MLSATRWWDGAYLNHTSPPSDGNCWLYCAGVLYTFYFILLLLMQKTHHIYMWQECFKRSRKFLFLPHSSIFFIYIPDKNDPSPACADVRQPLKHMVVIYTVHKSHRVQSPAVHPAAESFRTVHIFFFNREEENWWFMLTQAWSEMMYSRRN